METRQPAQTIIGNPDDGNTSLNGNRSDAQHWRTFITDCHQLLPPNTYRHVWHDYTNALHHTHTRLRQGATVIELMNDLLPWSASANQILTRYRGMQAGAHTAGTTITADTPQFMAAATRIARNQTTPAHWGVLRRYRNPEHAAALALALQHLTTQRIATLTAADLATAARDLHLHGQPLDPQSRVYLLAALANTIRRPNHNPAIQATETQINRWRIEAHTYHHLPLHPNDARYRTFASLPNETQLVTHPSPAASKQDTPTR